MSEKAPAKPADALVYRLWLDGSATWSVDVAAMLLAGLDPGAADASWPANPAPDGSDDYWRATRVRELLVQAFNDGTLAEDGIPYKRATPDAYRAWAQRAGLQLPEAWRSLGESARERGARLRERRDQLRAQGDRNVRKTLLAENPGLSDANLNKLLRDPKPASKKAPRKPWPPSY